MATMVREDAPEDMIPTAEELIERARSLIPYLEQQAPIHREARRITPDTMQRLQEAGLFKVIRPRRYGGYELTPSAFVEILMLLAKGDPSVGFMFGVLGVHSFHMGFYDERAAHEVWGDDPDALISSPYIPTGKAVRVEGGYRLSGRWPFSSGCENCSWTFLAGTAEGDEHLPIIARMLSFLLPREDTTIVDTWHVMGLQGTGSKDVEVKNVFVPDHRVERFPIHDPAAHPGYALNSGPLFRTPFLPLFYRAVSSASLGALEGMIDQFQAFSSGRITVMSEVAARDPGLQLALGQAKAGLEEMKATLRRDLAEMERIAAEGGRFEQQQTLLYMLNSTNAPQRAGELAFGLLRAAGANGIRTDKKLATYYNDILVIGQHSSNQPRTPGTMLGKAMLGLTD